MAEAYSGNDHFMNKDPAARALYDQLISLLRNESGLPDPRGNLELAYTVAVEETKKQ